MKKKQILPESFIAFFTVCGFFIGLTFSVISIEGAFNIVIFTILISFLFYMLIHICIIGFMDVKKVSKTSFNVEEYESINDELIRELTYREDKSSRLVNDLKYEKDELKKIEEIERKKNARKKKNAA